MKWLLLASLLLNGVLLVGAIAFLQTRGGWGYLAAKLRPASLEPSVPKSPHWQSKVETYTSVKPSQGGLVMLGDSLTEFAPWGELLHHPQVHNRGIAGDTVEGVSRRLEPIVALAPHTLVLMIGINDLLGGASADGVIAQHRKLLLALRAGLPDTRLIVQSLLPVHPRVNGAKHNPRIRQVNAALEVSSREVGAEWLDLFPLFWAGEGLADGLTHDGLHLSGEGYRVWVQALEPMLPRERTEQ